MEEQAAEEALEATKKFSFANPEHPLALKLWFSLLAHQQERKESNEESQSEWISVGVKILKMDPASDFTDIFKPILDHFVQQQDGTFLI
jgi:hypothetical protein